jgi:hypothetical protein
MQLLTLEQLRVTHEAGGVLSATLLADGSDFELQIETRKGSAKLVKSRAKTEVRRFADPRKALMLLREMGINEAHIDSRHWQPEQSEAQRRTRPDRSSALKAAHAALSYNEWLEAKVDIVRAGLASGDNRRFSDEEWEAVRAAKIARRGAA